MGISGCGALLPLPVRLPAVLFVVVVFREEEEGWLF